MTSPQTIPSVPRSVLIVIDDCGMRDCIGEVGPGGRWETVINRPLDAADYETLARIGREAGTRLQLAMILCYWDCAGVCAKVPTTTWMGAEWKPETDRAWMEASAQVFADHPDHIEFALHGVGHDYWIDGVPHVGEWADRETGQPWPREDLQRHIDCFRDIVAQTGLEGRVPYRVPESFVPCYFHYRLDDGNPASTGHLMAQNDMRYASTPFGGGLHTPSGEKPTEDGVFDSGILLLDRDNTDVRWNQEATVPPRLPQTSICGMHWGNFLSSDPERNGEVADRWIAYLREVDRAPGLMLAPNAEHCWSQWVAHRTIRVIRKNDATVVDLSGVSERAWEEDYLRAFTLECELPEGQHLASFESPAFDLIGVRETHGRVRVTIRARDRTGGPVHFEYGAVPGTFA